MATQLNATAGIPDLKVITQVTPIATERHSRRWAAIAPVAVTLILALMPPPSGLAHFAWLYFSIFAGVIVALILEPLPGAAIAIIGMTLVTVLARFTLFSPQ